MQNSGKTVVNTCQTANNVVNACKTVKQTVVNACKTVANRCYHLQNSGKQL